jgi:hypothetical protein
MKRDSQEKTSLEDEKALLVRMASPVCPKSGRSLDRPFT